MSLTERLTENAPSFMAELLELEATVAPMAAAAATSARTRRYFSVFKRPPYYQTCLPKTCQFMRIARKSPVDRSLAYMWDDPEIVAPERCRYDLAVEVPRPIRADGVGNLQFPVMQVAEIEIRGVVDLEEGFRTFPHRTELVYRTAELNVRHGFTDTARWLIALGLTLAPDAPARTRFEGLQARVNAAR